MTDYLYLGIMILSGLLLLGIYLEIGRAYARHTIDPVITRKLKSQKLTEKGQRHQIRHAYASLMCWWPFFAYNAHVYKGLDERIEQHPIRQAKRLQELTAANELEEAAVKKAQDEIDAAENALREAEIEKTRRANVITNVPRSEADRQRQAKLYDTHMALAVLGITHQVIYSDPEKTRIYRIACADERLLGEMGLSHDGR